MSARAVAAKKALLVILSLCVGVLGAWPVAGGIIRGELFKVGGRYGADLTRQLEEDCCYQVPIPPPPTCPFSDWEGPGDPVSGCADCLRPGHACDDEPKAQREPAIAAAPWDPDLLFAAFVDASADALGAPGTVCNGFSVSRDGGANWYRLTRPPAEPAFDESAEGFARVIDDVPPPAGATWDTHADPCTTVGMDESGEAAYLYLTGQGLPYLIRLPLALPALDPVSYPQAAVVPGADGGDKPFVVADAAGENVFVHWLEGIEGAGGALEATFLTVSCSNAAEFFEQNPHGCAETGLGTGAGIQLSYLMQPGEGGGGPSPVWGATSAVALDGTVYFAWPFRLYYHAEEDPPLRDQIFFRALHPPAGPEDPWTFEPPLPVGLPYRCVPEETCERPVVVSGQPGLPADMPGYLGAHGGPAGRSVNIATSPTHAVIGVDRSAPSACGRSGYVYVVYGAAEPVECAEDEDGCLDTNIYIVRSVDGGVTWGAPVRVNAPDEQGIEVDCPAPACATVETAGMLRRPLQFFPWLAVDGQGRVGVAYYDTHPDYVSPEGNPCDGNSMLCVSFSWSLDGGVTWEHWACVASLSQSGVGVGEAGYGWDRDCRTSFNTADYIGLTAASDGSGAGIFSPIWTDGSEYGEYWRVEEPLFDPDHPEVGAKWAPFMGDIYTASLAIDDPVFSLGDYDRDYDVDSRDLLAYGSACATSPTPPLCEIMDINRNGVIDNLDPTLLMQSCYSGPLGGGHSSDGESAGAGELALEDIAGGPEFVAWCLATMSAGDRAALTKLMLGQTAAVDAAEGQVLELLADAITP